MYYDMKVGNVQKVFREVDDHGFKRDVYKGLIVSYEVKTGNNYIQGEYFIDRYEEPENMSINDLEESLKNSLHITFT